MTEASKFLNAVGDMEASIQKNHQNFDSFRIFNMINVLSQMNRVASYFGDPVMTEDQIVNVILDVIDQSR